MKIIKDGGHRLFEEDEKTSAYVRDMLKTLRKEGMDAVRKFSREFDKWDPPSFELSEKEIEEAIGKCDEQLIQDTDFCQENVRRFAQQQLATMHTLEVESSPGVTLGHKHIPVSCVGSYVPGGVYPMFGSAQMSIIPAKVAGVDTVVACTPPVKGEGP
jgi:sulfopropanediol 3-dehydrogenase